MSLERCDKEVEGSLTPLGSWNTTCWGAGLFDGMTDAAEITGGSAAGDAEDDDEQRGDRWRVSLRSQSLTMLGAFIIRCDA